MSDPTMQAESQLPVVRTQPRLRLWPGVAILSILVAARVWAAYGGDSPTHFFIGYLIAPMTCLALMMLWWLFASGLPWRNRLLVAGVFAAVTILAAVIPGLDQSVLPLIVYGTPLVVLGWTGWLILTQRLNWSFRQTGLISLLIGAGIVFCLLRFEGTDGAFNAKFSWRWTPTPEEQFIAESKSETATRKVSPTADTASSAPKLKEGAGDWVEFRGPKRDNRVTGVQIETDFEKSAPKALWKHRIGPGWSSITVVGNRLFTQEQRGENEYIVCYESETGAEVWTHHDVTRFYEAIAGPGPRATPTFHEGQIYSLGANGRLNCLDATTGTPVWSRDIAADSGAKVPVWGFSSSPLVAHGIVSVFAGGPDGKAVIAYRADSGEVAWTAAEGALSYGSTQLATLDGVEQLLMITNDGMFGLQPETGEVLWKHSWPSGEVARVVQPAVLDSTDVLLGTGMGVGTRRIKIKHDADKWETTESWTSRSFKPYYNDFVVAGDCLYGFDTNIFMCVSLNDGTVKWRTRGYGNGQVLLIADQNLLLVLTEQGEVVLVEANPEKHHVVSRFQAIEGKTWNHPTLAHGKLYVRNGEEIAAFELQLKTPSGPAKPEPVNASAEAKTE